MSAPEDQADGFFEDYRFAQCSHPECQLLPECSYPLVPNKNSGKGRKGLCPEKSVWTLIHMAPHFRLSAGFHLLHLSER